MSVFIINNIKDLVEELSPNEDEALKMIWCIYLEFLEYNVQG